MTGQAQPSGPESPPLRDGRERLSPTCCKRLFSGPSPLPRPALPGHARPVLQAGRQRPAEEPQKQFSQSPCCCARVQTPSAPPAPSQATGSCLAAPAPQGTDCCTPSSTWLLLLDSRNGLRLELRAPSPPVPDKNGPRAVRNPGSQLPPSPEGGVEEGLRWGGLRRRATG